METGADWRDNAQNILNHELLRPRQANWTVYVFRYVLSCSRPAKQAFFSYIFNHLPPLHYPAILYTR